MCNSKSICNLAASKLIKMKKLELKHLAPYLPYGLKFLYYDSPEDRYILDLKSCSDEYVTCTDSEYSYNDIKLALKPLSDLTKIDEKSGIDIITLSRFVDSGHNHEKSIIRKSGNSIIVFTDECDDIENVTFSFSYNFKNISAVSIYQRPVYYNTSLKINEWLLKNHFDVFGLIKKGLAIDINTLK